MEASGHRRRDRRDSRRGRERRDQRARTARERRGRLGQRRLEQGARPRSSACAWTPRSCSSSDHTIDEKTAARARRRGSIARPTRGSSPSIGPKVMHEVEKQHHAAPARHALEGAHRRARLSAPRHSPARLCAAEPEARVQARGVRDVQRDARAREARRDHASSSKIQIRRPEDARRSSPPRRTRAR